MSRNLYKELRREHQEEFNKFPIMFAFDEKQFNEGMERVLHLNPTNTDKIYSIGGGGYIRKESSSAFHKMLDDFDKEMQNYINCDLTGEKFIFDMFKSELEDHEFCVTHDYTDTLYSLGLEEEDVLENPRLLHGLKLATASYLLEMEANGF